ncbi:MAG: pyruvate dehydrogenase (acetyl-transferring), homodimeric type [Candidatus Neomarinimicrobiota bacterium]|nr:MAG: pyruvate dehydrogenase (acetyl-transferring), homodimeric type [Candidatus Neomarinimicrobiota bacterium]
MRNSKSDTLTPEELREWIDALQDILEEDGETKARQLLDELQSYARQQGLVTGGAITTPFINTISAEEQPAFPGDRALERRIKSLIRWNAMAMVVRANMEHHGIGGHISTYASAATLYEVAFHHFFHGPEHQGGDLVFFQGHASPGIYSRAFLEGRLTSQHLQNFRRDLSPEGGITSYPHPWLMPDFWQFATVSMGLGPLMAIYQARFMKYLEDRGFLTIGDRKVWAFLGDGEMDEPESLGALTLAAREKLDNLIFVINCNLQRLDGPVRGNSKIIQELEGAFRGAGWNVIKVIWGAEWDDLLQRDQTGLLQKRMEEVVDGDLLKYVVEGGAYIRKHFFGKYPELLELVREKTDDELWRLRLGGHDPEKVYAAYWKAIHTQDQPTVILARTIKGYGMGEAGEGRNITHQQKELNEQELLYFRDRFDIPLSDEQARQAPFYRPADDSPEIQYLLQRRQELGGFLPQRRRSAKPEPVPDLTFFRELLQGSGERSISTTMAFVRLLTLLTRHPEIGKQVVPIIPDEARTFGMDPLFRQLGIYAHEGQKYEPVDSRQYLYYREARDGQILEEGINEAGAIASFIAAGLSYSTHGINMIPFYIYYSMFGFQRVGDFIWAAGDMRARGFLLGATAGRTTLNGEGLQHQDGHSHLMASVFPHIRAYDPAFAYELAVIIQRGLQEMVAEQRDIIYYLTLENENYVHPPLPPDVEAGILQGMYRFRTSSLSSTGGTVQLLGAGPMLREALAAAELLEQDWKVAAHVWSVTSFSELRKEAEAVHRWNHFHPDQPEKSSHLQTCLPDESVPVVAVSDYVKPVAEQIAAFVPGPFTALGTDGFGRSDTREGLRDFFEVNRYHIVLAALSALVRTGALPKTTLTKALQQYPIDPEKPNPVTV